MAVLNALAVAASGVTAAVYLYFAVRVMPALARTAPPRAVARMQELNRAIVRSPFIVAFFGAAVLGGYQVVQLLGGGWGSSDVLTGVAGLAYVAGFALTIGYHVPRNARLERFGAGHAGEVYWVTYQREWNRANVIRAGLSTASVGLGIAALVGGGG